MLAGILSRLRGICRRSVAFAPRGPSCVNVEPLESRSLLAGVTLITHGFNLPSTARPASLDAMKNAIVKAGGPNTAVYCLKINAMENAVPYVESFNWLAGKGASDALNSNSEVVVMLDWAAASAVTPAYTNALDIANLVTPIFLNTDPSFGVSFPLAELPIHLIGHSRGASVISHLARTLGTYGIEVDQVTTLDPFSAFNDPPVVPWTNVWFADNYYQTKVWPDGVPIAGAHNIDLSKIVSSDVAVRTYYHGTIDEAAKTDGEVSINTKWYSSSAAGPRANVGYEWSNMIGGDRPADGLWMNGAGRQQDDEPMAVSGAELWDNIRILNAHKNGVSLVQGMTVGVTLLYTDGNSDAAMTVGFDNDLNPYNGFLSAGAQGLRTVDGADGLWQPTLQTGNLPAGTYHLLSAINNGVHTRYHYGPGEIRVSIAQVVNGKLIVAGTSGNDTIAISVSGKNVKITRNKESESYSKSGLKGIEVFGFEGNDRVTIGKGLPGATISGGPGNDSLYGGDAGDKIRGDEGNDRIEGILGNDNLAGGKGNDVLLGSNGNDTVTGDDGNDRLEGGDSKDLLKGGTGKDTILGGNHEDSLYGGSNDDSLNGGEQNDTVCGEAGNDRIDGGNHNDRLDGGTGKDTVMGYNGNDTLYCKDTLLDILDGGAGTDKAQVDSDDVRTLVESLL